MKFLTQGLALAVVGAGLAAAPLTTAQAQPRSIDVSGADSALDSIQATADGDVISSRESATGKVGFLRVRGKGDLLPGRSGDSSGSAAAKSDAYLDRHASAFGARPGELQRQRVERSTGGWTVTYTQAYQGVPVFGSMLRAHIDRQGDLTSINGYAAPSLSLSTDPRFSEAEAGERAISSVKADPPVHEDGETTDLSGLTSSAELVVYRLGSTRGESGEAVLAWLVEVTNKKNVRDMVVVDAATGKPVNRWSLVHNALDRELYEASGNDGGTPDDPSDDTVDYELVWQEGDALPGDLNEDQEGLVRSTGESYWMFMNAFGRDSYDGSGATMRTVNNDPRISCPNANWNGVTTNYCDGVTSDDVVSHEWGHAYTEYTSGLIYQWQSGALNESYSDIWGETLDLINGRQDEGEGDITAKRADDLCSSNSPAVPLLTINSPSTIAKDCLTGGASFGQQPTAQGITEDVVAATDAVETGGTNLDGCSPYNEDVTGKIVLVNRGLCAFTEKAQVATDAGAAALIIGNRDDAPIGMSGDDPSLVTTVSIGLTDRESIRTSLGAGETVNVTIKDAGGEREDSFRWLVGEKSEAFGGAIRDMWKPTCYGDPGKVSDAEYKCSTDDSGGVHSNSGVPNHGYALLVDGGTYNGTTVEPIGMDKAAAIYWRAQTAYLTPTSDFTDHADALAASCADLTGQPINQLTTAEDAEPAAAEPITTEDCARVEQMATAVELREEPVQCNFQPLLQPGDPSLCGEGFESDEIFSEDFEDGLAGWETDQEVTYDAGRGLPWTATANAPDNHEGTAAYGPAPDAGNCSGAAGDISSRDSIVSPTIAVPGGGAPTRMTFDHYVATEAGYDGGNVKVSVNGGPFEVVPASAYLFNAPNGTITTAAEQNTNPMEGEEGFTGTDGGEVSGSWGTSVIDLEQAGVRGPATFQVRFDIGRDGCGGVDGWYVDDISVSVCKATSQVTAVHRPVPSTEGEESFVDATVSRDSSTGLPPKGEVTLTDAEGVDLGTATLESGQASIPVPADYPAGTHEMTVTYSGNGEIAGSSTPVTVTIEGAEAASSTTTLRLKPARVAVREPFKAVVNVVSGEVDPVTGRVRLQVDGDTVSTQRLGNGRTVFRVTKRLKPGRHRVVAVYLGTAEVDSSRDRKVLRVTRR